MDILANRMDRLTQKHRSIHYPVSDNKTLSLKEEVYEPIKESIITNKKIDPDLLDYDELIDTIIKKKPNVSTTRKILFRFVDEAENEPSDE